MIHWKSYAFACRILGNSNVAALVKSFSTLKFEDRPRRRTQTRPARGITCDLLDKNVVRAIDFLEDTERGRDLWFKAFHDCCDSQAAIAIALPFLPNLQHMNVTCDQCKEPALTNCAKQPKRLRMINLIDRTCHRRVYIRKDPRSLH